VAPTPSTWHGHGRIPSLAAAQKLAGMGAAGLCNAGLPAELGTILCTPLWDPSRGMRRGQRRALPGKQGEQTPPHGEARPGAQAPSYGQGSHRENRC